MYMAKKNSKKFLGFFLLYYTILVSKCFLVLKMPCYFPPRSQFTMLTSAVLLVAPSQNLGMTFFVYTSLVSANWLLKTSLSLTDSQIHTCLVHSHPSPDPAFNSPTQMTAVWLPSLPPFIPYQFISG